MEAYINDMVMKRKAIKDHISNLTETFKVLKKHCSMLNVSKCALE